MVYTILCAGRASLMRVGSKHSGSPVDSQEPLDQRRQPFGAAHYPGHSWYADKSVKGKEKGREGEGREGERAPCPWWSAYRAALRRTGCLQWYLVNLGTIIRNNRRVFGGISHNTCTQCESDEMHVPYAHSPVQKCTSPSPCAKSPSFSLGQLAKRRGSAFVIRASISFTERSVVFTPCPWPIRGESSCVAVCG
ncbi:hypothetical protein MSAN_02364300 [Mycena sanguinolenta]|uniref:Uncharacterized protein n=1 Tax=Mycena sanguinolenta TaxID=230812 RepID=A0A8H6X5Z9_9AGAR|nr:hypothetical protein MSAN_02364300 [Mycena sanguinolenta]